MGEPTRRRPEFPGYGIAADQEGMLSWSWATERLEQSQNYWISSADAANGPHAMPVWGAWVDGAVVFGTSATSRKGRNLASDPRVVVHLESGDEVVIIEGEAEEVDPHAVRGLDEEFRRKYDMGVDTAGGGGTWLAVRPRRAFAWLERDYTRTATRFDF